MANSDDERGVRFGRVVSGGFGVAGLAVLSAVVSGTVGGVAVLDSIVLWPAAGLALVAGLAVGSTGAAAVTLGYLVASLGLGTLDPNAGVAAASLFTFGYVASFLGERELVLPAVGFRITPGPARVPVVLAVASIAGGSMMAWGGEITRRAPFFVGLGHVVSYALTGVVIGLPTWYAVRSIRLALSGHSTASRSRGVAATADESRDSGRSVTVAVVSTVWLLVGTIGSLGYHGFRTVLVRFPYAFDTRGVDWLLVVHNDAVFGVGGSRAQAVFGGVMTSLLLYAFLDDAAERRDDGEGGSAWN